MSGAPACVAYVGVGSNLGDRSATIRTAIARLDAHPGIRVLRCSGLIETAPVGPPQPSYINGAVAIETTLGPAALLGALLQVERELGRVRDPAERMGPRTLDLDLLMYGDRVIDEPGLSVPHPRMAERAFVLVPLAEIAPNAVNPRCGRTVASLVRELVGPTPPSSVEGGAASRTKEVT
ncbi:MAG: 2-amino-4-hydroxy-6-hydroxymethyldihydropteridine diphosphokinase [Phycisphaerales bacterium]|nr:2-amino-4-hydroxy-6-hydroxymethyldihydropteridine diphosphokinase [Phycisphaerales bacterium]